MSEGETPSINGSPRSTSMARSTFDRPMSSVSPAAPTATQPDMMSIATEASSIDEAIDEQEETFKSALDASRKNFSRDTFGKIHFPDEVLKILGAERAETIINYILRPPAQATRRNLNLFSNVTDGATNGYDALHLNIPACKAAPDGNDEYHFRNAIHHDIAFAVHKLNAIQRQVCRAGYEIHLSVTNAHLAILMDFLARSVAGPEGSDGYVSYKVQHRIDGEMPDMIPVREEEDDNGKPYREYVPRIPREELPVKYYKYPRPFYVREVTELNIVKALEGLRLKCFTFVVNDGRGRQCAAYAFMREKAIAEKDGKGVFTGYKLGFDLEMKYYALPNDELPG